MPDTNIAPVAAPVPPAAPLLHVSNIWGAPASTFLGIGMALTATIASGGVPTTLQGWAAIAAGVLGMLARG